MCRLFLLINLMIMHRAVGDQKTIAGVQGAALGPLMGQGQSPCRGSVGRRPPEAED